MSKLLYIEASPRKSRSKSIEVSQVFLSELKNAHPSIEIDKLESRKRKKPLFRWQDPGHNGGRAEGRIGLAHQVH